MHGLPVSGPPHDGLIQYSLPPQVVLPHGTVAASAGASRFIMPPESPLESPLASRPESPWHEAEPDSQAPPSPEAEEDAPPHAASANAVPTATARFLMMGA